MKMLNFGAEVFRCTFASIGIKGLMTNTSVWTNKPVLKEFHLLPLKIYLELGRS